jgi:hypothetical protein
MRSLHRHADNELVKLRTGNLSINLEYILTLGLPKLGDQ